MIETVYAFRSGIGDHATTLYAWGTPAEAKTFAAIMRTARPCVVEELSEADLVALRPGTRILKLAISLETPL
jgi:hypothetical protein